MSRVSELYYEELGADFDRFMSPYDVARRQALIARLLPADAARRACLEVGCGTGAISRGLQPLVGALTVSDLSEKLARGCGDTLGCAWRAGDACALPFEDDAFDLVVSSECIEHTPDPPRALREMLRVARPGGSVVVTSPNKRWYWALVLARALGVRKFRGNEVWLSPDAIVRALCDDGAADLVQLDGCHLVPWQIPLAQRVLPHLDRYGRVLYPLMINTGVAVRKHGEPDPQR